MGLFSWLKLKRKPYKPVLGIALGSGGAKGFAEIGALKAFEDAGIEFDLVAGSSIGSIVGAFYASGYSATDIYGLLGSINPGEITTFLMLGMDTARLRFTIQKNLGCSLIEELKKPFRAIATDMESGEEKVFNSGDIATALCASAAIPPFFKAVEIDGKRYVDGAFSNSVPADRVREMGADFVVGIDLKNHSKPATGLLAKVTYRGKVESPWAKGYEFSDIVINPDLGDYTSTSFKNGAQMFELGYAAANEKMSEIKEKIAAIKKKKPKR